MARLALVPGDRQRNGSIPTLSAADNINLPVLDRYFQAGGSGGGLDENAQSLMTVRRPPAPRPGVRLVLGREPAEGDDGEVAADRAQVLLSTNRPKASTSVRGSRSGG